MFGPLACETDHVLNSRNVSLVDDPLLASLLCLGATPQANISLPNISHLSTPMEVTIHTRAQTHC
jgi:hypothetical protein